jgi:hypothetical protein
MKYSMNHPRTRTIRHRWWAAAALAGSLLLSPFAATAAPPAQPKLTDAEVVRWVIGGRYDRLAGLKARGQAGDPVAMYWWGRMLQECAFDPCDEKAVGDWMLRAARAGHGRARTVLYERAVLKLSQAELAKALGAPRSESERLSQMAGLSGDSGTSSQQRQQEQEKFLKQVLNDPRPSMHAYAAASAIGRVDVEILKALVRDGFARPRVMTETLNRRWLLDREFKKSSDFLARAKSGDPATATVLCDVWAITAASERLPDDLLPHCVAQLRRGQLGMASVLLTHHLAGEEWAEAAVYAKLCESQSQACPELGEYLSNELGRGRAWQLQDAAAYVANGGPGAEVVAEDRTLRAAVRKGLGRKVAREETETLCLQRRYDPATKSFEAVAGCPWGQPVSLPAPSPARDTGSRPVR